MIRNEARGNRVVPTPILTNQPLADHPVPMDMDELFAKRPEDPLAKLVRQDLDPLSVNELRERVAVLEAEIVRVNQKIQGAVNFKASAEGLFKS